MRSRPCCRPSGPRRCSHLPPGSFPAPLSRAPPAGGPPTSGVQAAGEQPHGPRPRLNSALLWVAWPLCDTSAPLPQGAHLWCRPRATSCPRWHPPVPPGPARASHPATHLAAFTVVTPLPPAPHPARGHRWALLLSLPVQQVRSRQHLPPSCPLPSPPVGPQPHSSGPSQALPTWVSSQAHPAQPPMAFQTWAAGPACPHALLPEKVPSRLHVLTCTHTLTYHRDTQTHSHRLTPTHTSTSTPHNPSMYILSHARTHSEMEARRHFLATQGTVDVEGGRQVGPELGGQQACGPHGGGGADGLTCTVSPSAFVQLTQHGARHTGRSSTIFPPPVALSKSLPE